MYIDAHGQNGDYFLHKKSQAFPLLRATLALFIKVYFNFTNFETLYFITKVLNESADKVGVMLLFPNLIFIVTVCGWSL
jgi:hypothetical protein